MSENGGSEDTAPNRYTEVFEKMCAYYLSIGMSYEQYWDGEADLCRYYREAHNRILREQNAMAWRQGAYVYQALLCAYPLYNALSKKKEAYPYPEEVIPIDNRQAEEIREDKNRRQMEENMKRMQLLAETLNQKFKKKEHKDE